MVLTDGRLLAAPSPTTITVWFLCNEGGTLKSTTLLYQECFALIQKNAIQMVIPRVSRTVFISCDKY